MDFGRWDVMGQRSGVRTSTPHLAVARAKFSMGRVRPAVVGMVDGAFGNGGMVLDAGGGFREAGDN